MDLKRKLSDIPVSVLDLAPITAGHSAADTFESSRQLAQATEAYGYKRYWFAEHHNMENIASAATAILIGNVAAVTKTIRIGSGGIMLPNHAPLIVAEQFGTLATLYPGRIDLGLGRAPGTDQLTALALRRNMNASVDSFPNDVMELQKYFGPVGSSGKVKAIPAEGTEVPIWILGSSTYGAQLAAALGLPYAFASHFAPDLLQDAIRLYRQQFQAGKQIQEPYAMACINVIAAETDEEAEELATSFYGLALGIIRNSRMPLQPPVPVKDFEWNDGERFAVQRMMKYSFIGSQATVQQKLQEFIDETPVQEIMVASYIYDHEKKKRSYELTAELFKKADR